MKSGPDTQTASGPSKSLHNRSAFMFRQPSGGLEFDGERYVSGVLGDIQSEHYHRYLFALGFCADKDVIDIASGEGYGSALLGQAARSVVGVDISKSAVAFANQAYLSQTVSYRVGDATDMPIETSSVDVVVSFETVEHLADHEKFFSEICRVLRPDGVLVMSSPNRPVFREQYGDDNHFHVRELDRDEFVKTIERHFKHHRLLEQRAVSGSVILASSEKEAAVEGFDSPDGLLFERHAGVPNAPYFVAVASSAALPAIPHSVMHSPLYLAHLEKIRNGLENDITVLRSEVAISLNEIASLRGERANLQEHAGNLERIIEAERVEGAKALAQFNSDLDEAIRDHRQHANILTNQVQAIQREREAGILTIAQLEGYVSELNRRLVEETQALADIQASTSWKLTYLFRRMLMRHPGSARFLRRVAKFVWWTGTFRIFTKLAERRRIIASQNPRVMAVQAPVSEVSLNRLEEAPQRCADDRRFTRPGPGFEEVDPTLFNPEIRRAKVVALYLPQFHPIPENDSWWGKGFTEWRNVVAAKPLFPDHHQPRLPRDLGYYDLRLPEAIRAQVSLAQNAGIFGFCFYYYFFNKKRILETPVDLFLMDQSIDFPFCVLWANENWTRRWDGLDAEILLHQDYRLEDDDDLIDDLARHFKDRRYIRIGGRPLFILYRPNLIPEASKTIARWRQGFHERHDLNPCIFMVQGFGYNDPDEFGLDGAIEFPPHKLADHLPTINTEFEELGQKLHARIIDYSEVVERSIQVEKPAFDLIRSVMPSWDNVPRRGQHGTVYYGSTPAKFESWLGRMVDFSRRYPVKGESFVFVNAWNEWAEGATLEPDLYWGGAYLNSVARVVSGTAIDVQVNTLDQVASKRKLLIVGHDAYQHGAQLNCLALVRHMREFFGLEVTVLLLNGGPLEDRYRAIAPTFVLGSGDPKLAQFIGSLANDGFCWAICNTVVTAPCIPILNRNGFAVVSLIHEMPAFIRERNLEDAARTVSDQAAKVVFAAQYVRDQFVTIAPLALEKTLISPQGLYQELPAIDGARTLLLKRLGLSPDAVIVINAGYGDLRKGIDLFVQVAQELVAKDKRFHFVWLGNVAEDMQHWIKDAALSQMSTKHIHQVPFTENIGEYFQGADIFALTSREDPFPSVVIEALACGLPVVAFDGGGGYAELVAQDGNGLLVPYLDVSSFADALYSFYQNSRFNDALERKVRSEKARKKFDFRRFSFDLLRVFSPELRSVSVIVPNYNYARYIQQRLESIFAQTYPIYQVLVLDDASTDDSLSTLAEFRRQNQRDFKLVTNRSNSGSVFSQWSKGAKLAQGELLWVAEADDLAAPDFVEVLAAKFVDPAVNMVFANSQQIDEDSTLIGESYDFYYDQHLEGLAQETQLVGVDFLKRYLSVRNPIFNVSSLLVRRDLFVEVLETLVADFKILRVAGDWLVYLEICRQPGFIAYAARSLNIHRRHANSVTLSLEHWRHLAEIQAIHCKVLAIIGFDEAIALNQAAYVHEIADRFNLVPLDGCSIEIQAAFQWLEDLAGDQHALFRALRTMSVDLVGQILLNVPECYPLARVELPHMPPDEVQISWTGSHGQTLLRQSCAFVSAVAAGFQQYLGRSLEDAKILDYGCGWGRLIRLMYKFSAPENLYGCDPWDRSIQLCKESNIRAHLSESEYLPTRSPFDNVKFDLIYAFSVFTHLSERSATAVLAVMRQTISEDGICVVTVRPVSYWDAHDQAQNIVDRDDMKRRHADRGFAFTPHDRDSVDGDITYGDTSISMDYIREHWTDWNMVGTECFPADPFQIFVFLRPRISKYV